MQLFQEAHESELSGTQTAVFTEIQLIGVFLDRHYHPYLRLSKHCGQSGISKVIDLIATLWNSDI